MNEYFVNKYGEKYNTLNYHRDYIDYPAGFIWYKDKKDYLDIGYILVHDGYRRKGIATKMINKLKEQYPNIIIKTDIAVNEVSVKFLVSLGFKKEQKWVLKNN